MKKQCLVYLSTLFNATWKIFLLLLFRFAEDMKIGRIINSRKEHFDADSEEINLKS